MGDVPVSNEREQEQQIISNREEGDWYLIQHQNHPQYLYWASFPETPSADFKDDDMIEIRRVEKDEDGKIFPPDRCVRSGSIPMGGYAEHYHLAKGRLNLR